MSCRNFNYGFTIVYTSQVRIRYLYINFFLKKTYTFVIQLFKNV